MEHTMLVEGDSIIFFFAKQVTALYGVATHELMHIFLSQGLVEKIMIILRNSMNWQNHERFTSKKLTKSKALIHLWPSNKHIIATNCGMNLCQLSMNVWSTKLDDFEVNIILHFVGNWQIQRTKILENKIFVNSLELVPAPQYPKSHIG